MSNNWTEEALADFYRRRGDVVAAPGVKRAGAPKVARPEPVSGPLSVTLVLHGHCPSKKNLWQRGGSGAMFLATEVKDQIALLTQQAIFGWQFGAPVRHPDLTVTFYVRDARRDRDGMFVTLLDCLQEAGVLVNDNLAQNNGRTILEPAMFVKPEDERVEILICKK